ncbi:hypothetical protein AB0J47_18560 [Nocardia sp. NPDC049737]|uniref:hypothetical protein n=1 Tax=Nocardia sp. NPDC049737 TaxID=3154358 RepID=UPI0034396CAA
MNPLQRIRDIHIDSGPLALDFQGSADQIHSVAAELGMTAYLEVTVDDDVRPRHSGAALRRALGIPRPARQPVEWPPAAALAHHDWMSRGPRDW